MIEALKNQLLNSLSGDDKSKSDSSIYRIEFIKDKLSLITNLADYFETILSFYKPKYTYKSMDDIQYTYDLDNNSPMLYLKDYLPDSEFYGADRNTPLTLELMKRGILAASISKTNDNYQLIVKIDYNKLGLKKPTDIHETDNIIGAFAKDIKDSIPNKEIEIDIEM